MKTHRNFSITTVMFAILMVCSMSGWAQLGKIHGTVKEGGQIIPQAKVLLYQGDNFTGKGMLTDDEGKYEFALLEAGNYTVMVTVAGKSYSQSVSVSPDESQTLYIVLNAKSSDDEDGDDNGPDYRHGDVEIFDKIVFDTDRNMNVIPREQIIQMSGPRDIQTIVAMSGAPIVQKDHGDPMSFKGARENANATYFDGCKIRGTDQIPLGSIEQVSVFSGGVPAEYGDALGAVMVVTTRNPSMSMGSFGKPLTKAERQLLKQQRKRGSGQGRLDGSLELACR